ncbi:hypothetical protein [Inconstantimicrobium mannanitabidum]|uniref:Uncharacterized protein n=1 Tax=Inconstantimicrobium mannanitabidum TaxID=1604901 RepID=A0ACB5R840_9CLOT|nr:hypothetical protein [Clostridium sp. TW13]GKX65354.1 hypothetical protein rsdtw13_06120 [Clostridium sp. TW13]
MDTVLIFTIINLVIIIAIIVVIFKGIQSYKKATIINREMNEKIDFIYNSLRNGENK